MHYFMFADKWQTLKHGNLQNESKMVLLSLGTRAVGYLYPVVRWCVLSEGGQNSCCLEKGDIFCRGGVSQKLVFARNQLDKK